MKCNIVKSSENDIEYIDNTLGEFNRSKVQYTSKMDYIPLNYHIKDESGLIIAGINAFSCWQMVYISEFYVAPEFRKQGIGSILLNKIEEEAKIKGATLSHTDTFDWQAKDFYLKHGYEIFGVIENCPPGHKRFFLKKAF
ncbi:MULTISPECIES: GNAT family N-acetyltransferase [Legionella]|uniref:GNAT family N-acetyltransferase n=1 Tax=Legionella resiliens TaxID=2905958 RepID=A0ABS8WZ72_9GAMM|nr:GNAT family N-acetyltransferase [Legionella sp. PC1000]MCE0721850.1 GNAT family N-acetyltransferase [Legionella sp. 9fVS26]MCE3531004.1 GNAT family N-acetyltransferase [Legionella sp. 8cVS16]QLZ70567.1 acyl-CoA N-acyltransferase [Legionella sp. PC1000]